MNETKHGGQAILEFLAVDKIVARLRDLEVSGNGISWTRFCGSLALVLVVLLFLSGSFMVFYYSPYPGAAYDSVQFAQYELPFGDVIRGVHHWSWNLLLVVMVLHTMRAFLVGAYKTPREMVWISGLLLLLFLPLCIITGDLLPWTQPGYWTTQVRASIISSVPLIGPFLLSLLQGGPRTGIVALTRFYVLHVLFMPFLLAVFVTFHMYFLRSRGISDPISASGQERRFVRLIPTMLNRWLLLFILTASLIGMASRFWFPVPFADPADPTDSNFVPHPEWWVLFLNKLLGIFKGPWTPVATVVIPGALFGLLLALPLLDRSPERRPLRRWKSMLGAIIILISIIILSCLSYIEHYPPNP
jgi:ubiquinol-cytochrome c reductase cytochrome b subunit